MNDTGDSRQQALRSAQKALADLDWRGAAQALERAARLAQQDGDDYRATHCLQMASALHRARGEGDRSIETAIRAGTIAGDDLRARFAAKAELGESRISNGSFAEAVAAYRDALRLARDLALPAAALATVMRRLAEAEAGSGAHDRAWKGYDDAARLMVDAGDPLSAAWIDIEHANQALQTGIPDHAREVVARARVSRLEGAEPHLRAERQLLLARASAPESATAAVRHARVARSAALEAVAPLSYLGAAVALAQSLEVQGERVAAYGALATANKPKRCRCQRG